MGGSAGKIKVDIDMTMEKIINYCGLELELTGIWDENKDPKWQDEIVDELYKWWSQECNTFIRNDGKYHGLYVYKPMKEWIENKSKGGR
jgi:hypothetical protein